MKEKKKKKMKDFANLVIFFAAVLTILLFYEIRLFKLENNIIMINNSVPHYYCWDDTTITKHSLNILDNYEVEYNCNDEIIYADSEIIFDENPYCKFGSNGSNYMYLRYNEKTSVRVNNTFTYPEFLAIIKSTKNQCEIR
jgi:hypothetical protein